jgi:hypothetical protein
VVEKARRQQRTSMSIQGAVPRSPQPGIGQAQQCFRECALNPCSHWGTGMMPRVPASTVAIKWGVYLLQFQIFADTT